MKSLGIDTSNYTTSASVVNGSEVICSEYRLLPVKKGEYGIRQNDAVFHHTVALPDIISKVLKNNRDISCIGVSTAPESLKDSYMPCFLTGITSAEIISSSLGIPLYKFSHQQGHIAAALLGTNNIELIKEKFIAFHVSGGTTKAVLVSPDADNIINTEIIAETTDLNAGQAVDRTGKILGIDFPAGIELEKLANNGKLPQKPNVCLKGSNCCLSGLENQCINLNNQGVKKEDIALYCLDFIAETLIQMTDKLIDKYGELPLVYAGGVMSDKIIKDKIQNRFRSIFAPPEYSRDNATGIALLANIRHDK